MIKIKKNLLIGIDLGTSSTKIYVKDLGIVGEIPTVLAINKRTKTLVAIGEEAKKMLGRAPTNIEVVRPVLRGVVTNFEEGLLFLEKILEKIKKDYFSLQGVILVIAIPLDLTEVQKKGVLDIGKYSGARGVYLMEEPLAAAMGANLEIEEAKGVLVCDIGGGTTDIALISLGGVVIGKSIKIGGDSFNESIISYLKSKHGLIIGESQAETAKIFVSSINPKTSRGFLLKGRDILTGLPKEFNFTSGDLRESIYDNLEDIAMTLKDIINLAPPDLLGDIYSQGLFLSGGGSLIEGIDEVLYKEVKIKINLIEEPKFAVIRGIGKVLEDFDNYKKYLINV